MTHHPCHPACQIGVVVQLPPRRHDGTEQANAIPSPASAGHYMYLLEAIPEGVYCFPLKAT